MVSLIFFDVGIGAPQKPEKSQIAFYAKFSVTIDPDFCIVRIAGVFGINFARIPFIVGGVVRKISEYIYTQQKSWAQFRIVV